MSKVLLITGATGKQGGSVVDALLTSPSFSPTTHTIVGVTRSPTSAAAQKLAAKSPAIKVIQGDFNDIPALFKTASDVTSQPVWGVFSVQVPMGKGQTTDTEEKYGKGFVDEALKQSVKQFVYTSVERGGDEKSWSTPTEVPHFISKHRVELHLRDQAAAAAAAGKQGGAGMGWTILRPVAFMENMTPNFFGKAFATMFRDALQGRSLQFVATSDIGYFAAEALLKPDEYRHRAIGLAGDDLTYAQADEVFQRKTGAPMPVTYGFVGSGLLWGVKELGIMFKFFRTDGYGINIEAVRKMNPAMMNLETWLEKKSEFKMK